MLQFSLVFLVPVLLAIATTLLVYGVILRGSPLHLGAPLGALATLGVNFFGYNRLLYWSVEHHFSGGTLGDQTNVAIGGVLAIVFWLPASVATSILIWTRRRKGQA